MVSWGTNMAGPAKYGYKSYMKIHSEYIAWVKSKGFLDRRDSFELVNIRLSKRGTLKISRPCDCCMGYLKQMGCRKIYYTTENGFSILIP